MRNKKQLEDVSVVYALVSTPANPYGLFEVLSSQTSVSRGLSTQNKSIHIYI